MSGSGSGNTPTFVGWMAAIVVGALVYALLQYKLAFHVPSAAAFGVAATLLVILILSSSGEAAAEPDTRVRKIVPQPESIPPEAGAEPVRPVAPTRVMAAPIAKAPPAAVEPSATAAKAKPAAKAVEAPAAKPKPAAKAKPAKTAATPKAEKPAAAARAAKAGGLQRLTAPRAGKADDLKEIEGIGPAMEKLVNGLGFYHFDQIAGWGEADVASVDAEMKGFKGRIARDRWVAQAKIIVTEGLEAFRERAKTNNY